MRLKLALFPGVPLLMLGLMLSASQIYPSPRFPIVRPDSLPAGTRINILIQQPGDATVNNIIYVVPAPRVVAPPVVIIPPKPVDPLTVALYDGLQIGTRGQNRLIVRIWGGKSYLTETLSGGQILVRGPNLLNEKEVTSAYKSRISELSGGTTTYGGLTEPAGVVAPSGFIRRTFPDGAVYYVVGSNQTAPPAPDPVPSTPTLPTAPTVPTDPGGRVGSREGVRYLTTYKLEGKQELNTAQFNLGEKYLSPNFKFSVDFRSKSQSVQDWRNQGINLFGTFSVTRDEWEQLPVGQGIDYATESGLHGRLEGAGYWEGSLEEIERYYQHSVGGARKGFWTANIESSSNWHPGNESNPLPGYSQGTYGQGKFPERWESAKNKTITVESTGEQNISLEVLANRGPGAWYREMLTRRANRNGLMFQIAEQRSSDDGLNAYGSTMFQGKPDKGTAYSTSVFYGGDPDVSHIGGDRDGNITINGRRYKIKGDQYVNETLHLDYYYQFKFDMESQDFNDIWTNAKPEKQNYESIWAAIKTRHVVADQVGHWQANRYRMLNAHGQKPRPTLMMRELMYEDNSAGDVNGQPLIQRVPRGLETGCINFYNGGSECDDYPKIWIPPYEMYTYYAVHRFLEGGIIGSGFHLFNAPGLIDYKSFNGYNQVYHSVTALFQARADLQPYERLFDNSTLEEQPEVKPNQAGDWQRYDAIQAYNYQDGVRGPQRPVYLIRYQPVPGGWRVVILGGHNLRHGEERTDLVRLPGGLLNANVFRITLRGPAAQAFDFTVSDQDNSQTYEAANPVRVGFEKPGYAGWVTN